MKTRRWLIIGIAVASLLILLAAIPVLWLAWRFLGMAMIMSGSVKETRSFAQDLQKPEIYKPAALTLARMCQAGGYTNDYLEFTNIVPRSTNGLGTCWGGISSNRATMEFGGGFWHFGYDLTLDEASSNNQTNVWILTMYLEGEPNRILLKFPLARSETNSQALREVGEN